MASWYERRVVPHIIRFCCGCELLAEERRAIVPLATGRVLELGIGAGANLSFYDPRTVREVVGIEPSPELREFAAAAPRADALRVSIQPGSAEALPFESQSFDTVVCTFTLCTVAEPVRALSEARRVLRHGGTFLFCEHGCSPDPGVAKWQRRLEPIWKRAFGGCHLTRKVGSSIEQHFSIERLEGHYQPNAPRIAGWIEAGRAFVA